MYMLTSTTAHTPLYLMNLCRLFVASIIHILLNTYVTFGYFWRSLFCSVSIFLVYVLLYLQPSLYNCALGELGILPLVSSANSSAWALISLAGSFGIGFWNRNFTAAISLDFRPHDTYSGKKTSNSITQRILKLNFICCRWWHRALIGLAKYKNVIKKSRDSVP
jgi:hypothetical protein